MAIGVSFNVGGGKNSSGLSSTGKHNERKYKEKKKNDDLVSNIDFNLSDENIKLIGTQNIYQDVKKIYDDEFSQAVLDYNSKQKRNDRKIDDYFHKISNDKKTNLYTEIIVQVGDIDTWENATIEDKKKMTNVFKKQLDLIQENFENFKIANATIHYDETSPHMHVVGVCVSNRELAEKNNVNRRGRTRKNGLEKFVSQSDVFTEENLREFHKIFDEKSIEYYNEEYNVNEVKKDKLAVQKHFDLSTYKSIADDLKRIEEENKKLKEEKKKLEEEKRKLEEEKLELENQEKENERLRKNLEDDKQYLCTVQDVVDSVKNQKTLTGKTTITSEQLAYFTNLSKDTKKAEIKISNLEKEISDFRSESSKKISNLNTELEKEKSKNSHLQSELEKMTKNYKNLKEFLIKYDSKKADKLKLLEDDRIEKNSYDKALKIFKQENSDYAKILSDIKKQIYKDEILTNEITELKNNIFTSLQKVQEDSLNKANLKELFKNEILYNEKIKIYEETFSCSNGIGISKEIQEKLSQFKENKFQIDINIDLMKEIRQDFINDKKILNEDIKKLYERKSNLIAENKEFLAQKILSKSTVFNNEINLKIKTNKVELKEIHKSMMMKIRQAKTVQNSIDKLSKDIQIKSVSIASIFNSNSSSNTKENDRDYKHNVNVISNIVSDSKLSESDDDLIEDLQTSNLTADEKNEIKEKRGRATRGRGGNER